MRRFVRLSLLIALFAGLAVVPAAHAGSSGASSGGRTFSVSIENLTDGQIMTPPVFALHNTRVDLFEVGEPASYGVKEIAENGNLDPLVFALSQNIRGLKSSGVGSGPGADGSGPVFAGETRTFDVTTNRGGHLLSTVSMVVCTNDGITGLDSVQLPRRVGRTITVMAYAYDAGTETNTEDLDDLVPPCSDGATGTPLSNPALAEGGVISMHPGISGSGDLDPAVWGFDGPVAEFTITRTG